MKIGIGFILYFIIVNLTGRLINNLDNTKVLHKIIEYGVILIVGVIGLILFFILLFMTHDQYMRSLGY